MMAKFLIRAGAACHVGKVRTLNEDNWLAKPEIGLWVVADGMGGHGGGDIASAAAVAALRDILPPQSAANLLREFEDAIARVNSDLRTLAADRSLLVVGTTLAAVMIVEAHFACVWCGDSRVYRLRAGELVQLSRDHSEVQDLIESGVLNKEEAKSWPRRNVVTRALGATDHAALDIVDGPVIAGDRFLLCTDGLTLHVEDAEIATALLGMKDPQQTCDELVALALVRGGADNVTVVLVACELNERTVVLQSLG